MSVQRARFATGLIWPSAVYFFALACNAPRQPEPPSSQENPGTGAPRSVPNETPQQRIERLEREARALARVDRCQRDEDCRAAPVGDRPCGGPRTYIPYCALTTDSAALFRKLEELVNAEREYNRSQGLMSTCEFRMPPRVTSSGGACRAAP